MHHSNSQKLSAVPKNYDRCNQECLLLPETLELIMQGQLALRIIKGSGVLK